MNATEMGAGKIVLQKVEGHDVKARVETFVTVRFVHGKFIGRCLGSRVVCRSSALDAAKKVAVKAQGINGRTGHVNYFEISGITLSQVSAMAWIAEWSLEKKEAA